MHNSLPTFVTKKGTAKNKIDFIKRAHYQRGKYSPVNIYRSLFDGSLFTGEYFLLHVYAEALCLRFCKVARRTDSTEAFSASVLSARVAAT